MSKGTTIVTWIVIVIILILIGGFWWYSMQQTPSVSYNITNTQPQQAAENEMTSFSFSSLNPPISGTVDNEGDIVTVTVPRGTDVASLSPMITVSDGATVSPASGMAENFTDPVMYTVTGQDGSTKTYTVAVSIPVNSVKINTKAALGQFLIDTKGMTLYYFLNDKQGSGQSTCTGQCAILWPPFYAATLNVSAPLKASDFSVVTRSDGQQQLAYKGWPLYYYAKDKVTGDTTGEGVGNVWYVAKP